MIVLTIAGRLGRDAELRHTASGDPVLGFSVGVSVRRRGEDATVWVDCSLWGKRGESLSWLRKGTAVTVSGSGDLEEYQRRDGGTGSKLTIRVAEVTVQSRREDNEQSQPASQPAPQRQRPAAPQQSAADSFDADDLPF